MILVERFVLFQAIQVVIPVLPGFIGCVAGAEVFGPAAAGRGQMLIIRISGRRSEDGKEKS